MRKKVLITGGSGLLGANWALYLQKSFSVIVLLNKKNVSLEGIETDTVTLNSIKKCSYVLEKHTPDIVINTAGLTNVELCERNPDLAKTSNVKLAKNFAIACNQRSIKLIHISTDHLFSGNKKFYSEICDTNPLNKYAETKLLAEKQVLKYSKNALIIRTNFFGWGPDYRESFSDFIINNLRKNKRIDLFSDVFFTPIFVDELFKQVLNLVNKNANGIFNVVGNERISKYDFGIKLAHSFKLNDNLIRKIGINDYNQLVKRPKDMSLSNKKLYKTFNCKIPNLEAQIKDLKKKEKNKVNSNAKINIIPYGKHFIDNDDIKSVVEVLKNGMLTQGPKVSEFENKIAKYVGAKYAVAVANGTAALHLSCLILGLNKDDAVIISPNTFVATSNSALYVGAKPLFVDIDPITLNIDINKIEKTLKRSKNVKAIFPVHFAGMPCNMEKVKKLADKYNLAIVEDGCHALGAKYKNGNRVGNCEYSNLTTFSFHPVKGIASGEGGVITTNCKITYNKLTILRSHGITKGNFEFPGISIADNSLINKSEALEDGELKRWYYEMQFLGYNYRITDIQCALASSQMDKIDKFLKRRRELVKNYDEAFSNKKNIKLCQLAGREQSSHHIYVVKINFKAIGHTRNEFMKKLANQGVGSQVHYIPVICQPYYKSKKYDIKDFPVMQAYYNDTLSIPLYYGLTNKEQNLVIETILNLLN